MLLCLRVEGDEEERPAEVWYGCTLGAVFGNGCSCAVLGNWTLLSLRSSRSCSSPVSSFPSRTSLLVTLSPPSHNTHASSNPLLPFSILQPMHFASSLLLSAASAASLLPLFVNAATPGAGVHRFVKRMQDVSGLDGVVNEQYVSFFPRLPSLVEKKGRPEPTARSCVRLNLLLRARLLLGTRGSRGRRGGGGRGETILGGILHWGQTAFYYQVHVEACDCSSSSKRVASLFKARRCLDRSVVSSRLATQRVSHPSNNHSLTKFVFSAQIPRKRRHSSIS